MTGWRAGAVVAAGWAGLLGLFVVINAGYGQGLLVLLMFASAVVLAALFGLVVLVRTRRGMSRRWRVPAHLTSAQALALAAGLVVVGVALTWTTFLPAFWLLLLAARRSVRERRR